MDFRVLGPTEIYDDSGNPLVVSRARQRAILCVLLLNPGHFLTGAHLSEALWGLDMPADPRGALRSYVYNLRKVAGLGERLRTHTSGYGFQLDDHDLLDVRTFTDLSGEAREAHRAGDHQTAVRKLRWALDIWREPPLADVPATPVMQPLAAELLEMRNVAQETLVDARMTLGEHRDLLPSLKVLAAAEPLRERRWEYLMLALYRSGRKAEALNAYLRARAVLHEEYGIEPGPGLREFHHRVLTDDPALIVRTVAALRAAGELGSASHRVLPAPLATPHQLPNPIKDFIGRQAELITLDKLARDAGTTRHPAIVVAICGGPGIGKSALAIHAAHRIGKYFPDGELYIDLKGFGPQGRPVAPDEALQEILGALGIAPEQLPASVDARASFYRSMLANRKMLVVADNVFDSAQVRPLVPASPGCMMIATSRRQIANMVTSVGAHLINLDVLSSQESQELLVSRSGSGATAGEAEAVAQLADLCDRLPLALAVIAARAAARPGHTLGQVAAVMGQSANRLDMLNDFESADDVRTAFSWSYAKLTAGSARMFRLLSLHQCAEITVAAAADLAGVSITVANMALTELTQMHLVTERSPGRFYLHKLLRDYATEMREAEEAAADRNVA